MTNDLRGLLVLEDESASLLRTRLRPIEETAVRWMVPKGPLRKTASSLIYLQARDTLTGIITGALREAFKKGYAPEFPQEPVRVPELHEALKFLVGYDFGLIEGINRDLADELAKTLERSFLRGWGPKEIEREIRSIFQTTSARAEAIARTEINRAANVGIFAAYRERGISLKRWSATPEQYPERTCVYCFLLHNTIVPLPEMFPGGRHLDVLHPPLHPYCRCRILAAFPE